MSDLDNIRGIDKAVLLVELHKHARVQGYGFMAGGGTITLEQARKLIADTKKQGRGLYIDYLNGRVMKVDLTDDETLDPGLYDRDNGRGLVAEIVQKLRGSK